MRIPERLEPLVEQGVIDDVLRPLMSGKEAQVYLVEAHGEIRVAKVFKEVNNRSFKHRADYVEGRKVRDTRSMRAMAKGSRFGRKQVEETWRNAEVDAIYKLREAGVSVPEPFDFVDGVLVMELVKDHRGEPAPRLVDLDLAEDEALPLFDNLLRQTVWMLCAGVVHGDLSDFNILLGDRGPVIIDLPQAVDPAHNRNARKLLIRDVDNLVSFFARWAPRLKKKRYGQEMWDLYERGELQRETKLTGKARQKGDASDLGGLLAEIAAVEAEAMKRREALGLGPPRAARTPKEGGRAPKPIRPVDGARSGGDPGGGPRGKPRRDTGPSAEARPPAQADGGKRRKRRGGGSRPRSRFEDAPPPATDIGADLDALLFSDD